jgi:hypothetical protein
MNAWSPNENLQLDHLAYQTSSNAINNSYDWRFQRCILKYITVWEDIYEGLCYDVMITDISASLKFIARIVKFVLISVSLKIMVPYGFASPFMEESKLA